MPEDNNQALPWGNQGADDNATPPAVAQAEFVPMYWIHFIDQENSNPPEIFGRSGYLTDEGFFVVKVDSADVFNELGRMGQRLVTQEEYDQHLTEIAPEE